jgi:outer membrane protein OmpA-like peptidoglycan-associated protein
LIPTARDFSKMGRAGAKNECLKKLIESKKKVERSRVRKIIEVALIAVAGLTLASGCAMSPEKRQAMLMGAASAGSARCRTVTGSPNSNAQAIPCPPGVPAGSVVSVNTSDLTVYSEVEEAPPPPPLMAQESASQLPSASEEEREEVLSVPAAISQLPPTPSPPPASTPPVPPPSPSPSRTPVAPVTIPQALRPASPPPPPPVREAAAEEKIILRGVLFAKDSADLSMGDELILDMSVDVLKRHPKARIFVKGYSDSRGNPTRNQFLSQERAATVAAYLQSQGVPLNQLIVLGMGSTHPIGNNGTAAGRAKNRRVELEPMMDQS